MSNRSYSVDLHIHSCLSPCADIDVSPKTLAQRGAALGLSIMALTDHNSSLNCPAFDICCKEQGITPLFGMELTTIEEVHMLCLFGDLNASLDFHHLVHQDYPRIPLDEDFWNPQYVVDEQEHVIEQIPYLLTSASSLDLSQATQQVHSRGGICIPAHIDRSSFSLYSQLGFMTTDPFDGVEITLDPKESAKRIQPGPHSLVANSDCHQLEELGQRHTRIFGKSPGFADLTQALKAGATQPLFHRPSPALQD